ncbi:MAG: hypothetical protein OXN20_04425 [Gemmatimonadota bacterium]|nr:hypothetical protein [Gemmatimonadota bacterium]
MADNIPIEHRFHFDLSGFLVLRNVLTPEECETTLNVLSDLESRTYKDEWMASAPTFGRPKPLPTCVDVLPKLKHWDYRILLLQQGLWDQQ